MIFDDCVVDMFHKHPSHFCRNSEFQVTLVMFFNEPTGLFFLGASLDPVYQKRCKILGLMR